MPGILARMRKDEIDFGPKGGSQQRMPGAPSLEQILHLLQDYYGRPAPPAITDPLEIILLFTRSFPLLALDSNGLRVLLRVGFGLEQKNYSASYRSVQEALKDQIGKDYEFLIRAHQLLRRHGKELCRTNYPACEMCP